MEKVYHVWKTKANGDPISGSDRYLTGPNRDHIIRFLEEEAGLEKSKYRTGRVVLQNGDKWFVTYLRKK